MLHPSMKAKLDSLEEQKARLELELANAEPEQPVLLHPGLAQMYKKKVADLTAVLNDPETKAEATTIIRSMLSEIRLTPREGALEIELVGELAGLLTLGQKETASKRYASGRSLNLVAGVGFEPTTFRF